MLSTLLAFNNIDAFGVAFLLALLTNLYLGPASAAFLMIALIVRKGLKSPLRILAVINLLLGGLCALSGEPVFIAQIVLSIAVLVVLASPRLAAKLFGGPLPPAHAPGA